MNNEELIKEIRDRVNRLPKYYAIGAMKKYKDFVEWLKEEIKEPVYAFDENDRFVEVLDE